MSDTASAFTAPIAAPADSLPRTLDQLRDELWSRIERAIDWLWLGRHDMRRARFAWTGVAWSGTWVAP